MTFNFKIFKKKQKTKSANDDDDDEEEKKNLKSAFTQAVGAPPPAEAF